LLRIGIGQKGGLAGHRQSDRRMSGDHAFSDAAFFTANQNDHDSPLI
jgi:hypothetical protein